jgi:hypothetical protein
MATIKSYTSLEQSKVLVKILPIESADMYYREWKRDTKDIRIAHVGTAGKEDLPCWSLVALLSVLPDYTLQDTPYGKVFVVSEKEKPIMSDDYDNPVDACYEMILKLHELKKL